MWRRVVCIALVALGAVGSAIQPVHAAVPWAWPVAGPIIRGFEPPDGPYGAGHRGIDIAADLSTVIVAADDGVVTFAGKVGGRLFVTIDHGGGLTSTCSFLNGAMVRKGDHVARGQPVALTGWGHADEPVPHLHFGVRRNGAYVDPLEYLSWPSVSELIRLAPLDAPAPAPQVLAGRMTSLAYPPMARAAGVGGPGGGGDPGRRGVRGGRRLVVAVSARRGAERAGPRRNPRAALHRFVERARRYR